MSCRLCCKVNPGFFQAHNELTGASEASDVTEKDTGAVINASEGAFRITSCIQDTADDALPDDSMRLATGRAGRAAMGAQSTKAETTIKASETKETETILGLKQGKKAISTLKCDSEKEIE